MATPFASGSKFNPFGGPTAAGKKRSGASGTIDQFIRGEIDTLRTGVGVNLNVKKIQQARKDFAANQAKASAAGTAGTTVDTLPSTFEQALAQANKKNEERSQRGHDIFGQMQTNVDTFGQTRREQISRGLEQDIAADTSNLVSRGLFNSSGIESLERGRKQDAGFQQTALEEAIARSRNEILSQQVGFIERRTDQGPDPTLFANLQSAATSAPRGSSQISDSFGVGSRNQNQTAGATLSFKGPTTGTRSGGGSQTVSFNDQQTILGFFGREGASLSKLSGSERNDALKNAGINIRSVADLQKITPEQIERLKQILGISTSGSSPHLNIAKTIQF